jgi:uncharacterized membrane protein (GlpM family)
MRAAAALRCRAPVMLFTLGLLLKIVMTTGIVVAASVVVERSGPFIGSLIASLPTAGGAAMIILAFEHEPAFIAQSAIGSMVAGAIVAVFALAYAALAQRKSLVVSLSGAFLVWFAAAVLSRFVDWGAAGAVVLTAIVFPLTVIAGRRFRSEGVRQKVKLTGTDLAWRAALVTLCVLIVTAASYSIGSYWSGLFAFFPVAMASYFVILQPRIGGPSTASVAAHVQAPLIGLNLSLLVVHWLAVPVGVWWSYLIGLAVGVSWNAMLWFARHRLTRWKTAA